MSAREFRSGERERSGRPRARRAGVLFSAVVCGLVIAAAARARGEGIEERFPPLEGFARTPCARGSFGEYLRRMPLKPRGSPVLLFDGSVKRNKVHAAVFDMAILDRDLIQCADAVMKVRAEYLYAGGRFDDIAFSLTNGMAVPFSRFSAGYRVAVNGNRTSWVGGRRGGTSREVFDQYLYFIYTYSGTLSLARDTASVTVGSAMPGDIFLQGGSPGHAVMVVDVAIDAATGRKAVMLAQSYMPSQEFHVLKGPRADLPWYVLEDRELKTPEWTFPRGSLRRFR